MKQSLHPCNAYISLNAKTFNTLLLALVFVLKIVRSGPLNQVGGNSEGCYPKSFLIRTSSSLLTFPSPNPEWTICAVESVCSHIVFRLFTSPHFSSDVFPAVGNYVFLALFVTCFGNLHGRLNNVRILHFTFLFVDVLFFHCSFVFFSWLVVRDKSTKFRLFLNFILHSWLGVRNFPCRYRSSMLYQELCQFLPVGSVTYRYLSVVPIDVHPKFGKWKFELPVQLVYGNAS